LASSHLPAGCSARPVTLEDIPALSSLFRRRDEGFGLVPEPAESFLGWMLRLPFVRLERDTVVVERDDAIVAALTAHRDPASVGSVMRSEGVVDPASRGEGLGAWLVEWLMALTAERRDEWPFDIHALTPSVDNAAHALLLGHGFAHIRGSWEMELDLATPRAAVELPAGVALRVFEVGRDERRFWELHETAFVDHFDYSPTPFETFEAEWFASDSWDPSAVVFAESDGEAVGVIAWVEGGTTDGYIADVSVLPSHRRRGIAAALLRRAFDDIARAGRRRATLTVDSENTTGAAGVYERVGMRPYREWHVYARSAG
jgi:mycothiol synthase